MTCPGRPGGRGTAAIVTACLGVGLAAGTGGPAVAPCHAATLFGLVDTGEVHASTDGGATWTVRSTLPVSDAVAVRGFPSGALYLLTRSGSVRSSGDGGATWSVVGALPQGEVADLYLRPDGTLHALTARGLVFRSTDGGASWSSGGGMPAADLVSLTADGSGALLAATRTGTVWSDGGAGAWSVIGAAPSADAVALRALGSSLFLLTGAGDIHASPDGGGTWLPTAALSQVGQSALLAADGELIVASREGHVARSADGGTWNWIGTINQLHVTALGTDTPSTGVEAGPPPGAAIRLSAPRPNPLRSGGASSFAVRVDRAGPVRLTLLDVTGRRVAARTPEHLEAGTHSVAWSPGNLPPGVYVVRLEGGGTSATTKWTLTR